jgi:iron complex transport system substrate-binding protein
MYKERDRWLAPGLDIERIAVRAMAKGIHIIVLSICAAVLTPVACCQAQEMPAQRIISLTPATTEILFALGLDDEIIAVSSYCTWPLQARDKAKVGSFSNPNIEKIITLKPDLILVTGMEQENLTSILSSLDIRHISVDPKNIDELMASIKEIGAITGRPDKAGQVNKNIKDALTEIERSIAALRPSQRPKVYMEIWYDPVMSPGKGSFVDDMIRRSGGINITSDLRRSYSRIDPEEIIFRDPDRIILAYMKSADWVNENFYKRLGWENITAIRDNRVYAGIDPDIILRPGPRIAQGLTALYERFYEN